MRLSKEHPGIGIICLGPLTNLATAFLIDPTLSFGKIEIMGGTSDSIGNITDLAEFNIYQDPEAAFIVFERASHVVITPWETVNKPEILVTAEIHESWNLETKKAKFLREIIKSRFQLCDGIAVAAAIDPSIITDYEERSIFVELGGNYSRGHTIIRKSERFLDKNPGKNFKLIRRVDPEKFYKMVLLSLH